MVHPKFVAGSPVRLPSALDGLDQTTVRALCDAGYVDTRSYLELARANGWLQPAKVCPPMQTQTVRPGPQPMTMA